MHLKNPVFNFSNLFTDAHPQSQITGLVWLDNETLISSGQDCNVKVWEVEGF